MTTLKSKYGICVEIPFRQNFRFRSLLTSLLGGRRGGKSPALVPTGLILSSVRVLASHLTQNIQNSRASIFGFSSAHRLGFLDYFEILPVITYNFRKEGKALILSSVSFFAYIIVIFPFTTHEKPEQKVTSLQRLSS